MNPGFLFTYYRRIAAPCMGSVHPILLSGMLILLTGCVTLYKPNAIYSPLVKEKGDVNASASLGISGCGLFNLQAAYAISDHAGVMIDGMNHNKQTSRTSSSVTTVEKLHIFSGEIGAGYFTPFGDNKKGLFQCYSGIGYGNSRDRIYDPNQPNPLISAKYYSFFIQPGIAYTSKNFDVAFDLRANSVSLFNIHAYLYDQFEWWNTDFQFYSDTTLYFMNLEPTITIKAGGEKLKGVLQSGATIPTINSDNYFKVNSSSMLLAPLFKFTLGIQYTFGNNNKR
jgi:hypothetical protein